MPTDQISLSSARVTFLDYQHLLGAYVQEAQEWSEVIAEARGLGLDPQDVMDYLRIVGRHKE